jgi:hypothetical protein
LARKITLPGAILADAGVIVADEKAWISAMASFRRSWG